MSFSSPQSPVGIQVGTAIALLARGNAPEARVGFRNLWGRTKRQQLVETAFDPPEALYEALDPPLELGLPFLHSALSRHYFDWPSLPELFPTFFPGVKTSRDDFLVAIDRDVLLRRLEKYFDPAVSHEEMRQIAPAVMTDTQRFRAEEVRDHLRKRGFLVDNVIRYAYRPLDIRWLYWEPQTKLLDEKRIEYWPHVFEGNRAIVTQQKPRREWSKPQVIRYIGCLDLMDRSATCIPIRLTENVPAGGEVAPPPRANLSGPAS